MRRPAQPAPDWEGCLAGKGRGIAQTKERFYPPGLPRVFPVYICGFACFGERATKSPKP